MQLDLAALAYSQRQEPYESAKVLAAAVAYGNALRAVTVAQQKGASA